MTEMAPVLRVCSVQALLTLETMWKGVAWGTHEAGGRVKEKRAVHFDQRSRVLEAAPLCEPTAWLCPVLIP